MILILHNQLESSLGWSTQESELVGRLSNHCVRLRRKKLGFTSCKFGKKICIGENLNIRVCQEGQTGGGRDAHRIFQGVQKGRE